MAASKAWQAKKADAGFACITWPKEWGGPGGQGWQSQIFSQEEAKYPIPGNPFQIGLGMCVPTIMTCGNETDKQRFVGPALRGSSGEASLATLGCSSSATACGLTGGTGAGVDSGALA